MALRQRDINQIFEFDQPWYKCIKTVNIPESCLEIKQGDVILDRSGKLNIFQRFYAWLMDYIAWDYTLFKRTSPDVQSKSFLSIAPRRPHYMKASTFYRYFERMESNNAQQN